MCLHVTVAKRSTTSARETALLSTAEMAELCPGETPLDWAADAYAAFTTTVLAGEEDYPCHFGVQGQQRGHNWFTFVDPGYPESFGEDALAQTLLAFRERAWTGPKRQSLIVFVGPPEPDAELVAHHTRFWALLSALSRRDPEPWAPDIPRNTDDPAWQWCFAGESWFVFAGSPGYRARRSRNLGPCLTLIFQVGRVFEGIGGSTAAGKAAKHRVRGRLERYDSVPPHPFLGEQHQSSQHKWRQYALPDDQATPVTTTCPFV